MSSGVFELKTRIISDQMAAVSQEIDSGDSLQPIVWTFLSIGYEWRSIISVIVEQHTSFDFRAKQSAVMKGLGLALLIGESVLEHIGENKIDGKADVVLMCHEIENIIRWVDAWPTEDSTVRDASRLEMQKGLFASEEELLLAFQKA